jgi:hypothetical protein
VQQSQIDRRRQRRKPCQHRSIFRRSSQRWSRLGLLALRSPISQPLKGLTELNFMQADAAPGQGTAMHLAYASMVFTIVAVKLPADISVASRSVRAMESWWSRISLQACNVIRHSVPSRHLVDTTCAERSIPLTLCLCQI